MTDDYAPLYLDGGGDPSFRQIDAFLRAHFNAHAEYNGAEQPASHIDVEQVVNRIRERIVQRTNVEEWGRDALIEYGVVMDILDEEARDASRPGEYEIDAGDGKTYRFSGEARDD